MSSPSPPAEQYSTGERHAPLHRSRRRSPTGSCTFGYVVSDASTPPQISNVATVDGDGDGRRASAPVANNDTAATTINSSIPITRPGQRYGNQQPHKPDDGHGNYADVRHGNRRPVTGIVTYTAPAVAGTYTFTYTVKDTAIPPATSNLAT